MRVETLSYASTTEVPGCGYGHYVFLWDRKQQATKQRREKEKQKVRGVEEARAKATHGGWAKGKLQRRSGGLDAARDGADLLQQHQRSQATQEKD